MCIRDRDIHSVLQPIPRLWREKNHGLSIRRSKKKVCVANDARIKTCISGYDNGAYTRIQFLSAVSHNVGAHSNALCEVDNLSDSDDETHGDTAAAEPQEQHTQPCTSHTVWRPCRAVWGVPHPAMWIASGTGALRPLQILRIVLKRGSPHSAWLSTVPHADRCDSAFVLIFNSVGTVTDLLTFNSYF